MVASAGFSGSTKLVRRGRLVDEFELFCKATDAVRVWISMPARVRSICLCSAGADLDRFERVVVREMLLEIPDFRGCISSRG